MEAPVSRLDERGPNMMNDRETLGRNDLNTFEIAILRQMRIDEEVRPLVGSLGFNNVVFRQRDDHIRLTNLPRINRRKLQSLRHLASISLRRAIVDPLYDLCDFVVGEGH